MEWKTLRSAGGRPTGGEVAEADSPNKDAGHKAWPGPPASSGARRNGRVRGAAGFTLTELLVSILVLTVGCMAVISMQASGMSAGDRANSLAVATLLAEAQAEWIQTQAINRVSGIKKTAEKLSWDGSPCDEATGGTLCFTRTTNTACFTPTTRSCEVAIVVEWQATDGAHSLIYDTVVSDFGF